jgi:hypothetical protein
MVEEPTFQERDAAARGTNTRGHCVAAAPLTADAGFDLLWFVNANQSRNNLRSLTRSDHDAGEMRSPRL